MAVITGMTSGGAERVMATLCNEFSLKNDVRLIILKGKESDYYLADRISIIFGNIKNKNLFQSVYFVKKQIELYRPDVIISFMTKTNIVTLLSEQSSKYKCPVVISERANPFNTKGLLAFLRNKLYKYADGCVFQTKQAQDYYSDILKCKSVVIRNPLAADFNPDIERKKKIVCTARLSVIKNQQLLIKAFSLIKEKYLDYKVELYGDGPNKDNLQKLICKLNLEKNIYLMGRKKNIIEYIKDASLFVLPSNSEGMPNALLEAMALGIPSIATNCPIGGPADIIDNYNNGILITMNNENELVRAIEKILDDKKFADKISKNATDVVKDFETKKICRIWESYLYSMLGSEN